eukprot:c46155_g1_i1 orf=72-227(+)
MLATRGALDKFPLCTYDNIMHELRRRGTADLARYTVPSRVEAHDDVEYYRE